MILISILYKSMFPYRPMWLHPAVFLVSLNFHFSHYKSKEISKKIVLSRYTLCQTLTPLLYIIYCMWVMFTFCLLEVSCVHLRAESLDICASCSKVVTVLFHLVDFKHCLTWVITVQSTVYGQQ